MRFRIEWLLGQLSWFVPAATVRTKEGCSRRERSVSANQKSARLKRDHIDRAFESRGEPRERTRSMVLSSRGTAGPRLSVLPGCLRADEIPYYLGGGPIQSQIAVVDLPTLVFEVSQQC